MTPARTTAYWTAAIADFVAPTALAIDRVPTADAHRRRTARRPLSQLSAELEGLGDRPRSVEAVAQVLWSLLLSRYSGDDTVLFGFDFDGRRLPVRVSLPEEATVGELLERRAGEVERQRRHLDLDSEEVPGFEPLVESCMGWSTEEPAPESGPWPALRIHLVLDSDPHLSADYAVARFHPKSVDRLLGHLETLLWGLLSRPAENFRRLPLLTPGEHQQVVVEWNATGVDYPSESCLHELFEARAADAPEATAVFCHGQALSYGELNSRANRLAHQLIELGVGPDIPVGLCVSRSFEMVVGLLGILKAGGAYVPLDPSYPEDRLAYLLEDSDAPVLVTLPDLSTRLESSARKVLIGAGGDDLNRFPDTNPERRSSPTDLAYLIYTSGSTGRPKGAVLDHRGRVNNFTDFNRRYRVAPGDRLLAVSSLSFDMTAYDVFGTLAAGAAIVLVPDDARIEPARWAELIANHEVTVWHSVPALLEMLVEFTERRPELRPGSLRLALLGGDWIPVALPNRLRALAPEVHVVSMGGATEVSMDSTIYDIEAVDSGWTSIPYGRPMANQLAYVLDRRMQPVPVGVPAELHLGGVGVGRGYWKRPDLTAEKFVENPFRDDGYKLYKTGDLARFGEDGNLELLGRMDFQVKVRGYRIELGEIESVLRRHPAVRECVVLARKTAGRDLRLVGYVLPAGPTPPDHGDLARHLGEQLPEYMVPQAFAVLDRFPLTPNGKLNRKALPDPEPAATANHVPYRAPESALEAVVASVWAGVLRLERVGADDRFISLGGSSLLAAEAAASLHEVFGVAPSVTDVFDLDVSQLAARLSLLGDQAGADLEAVAQVYEEVSQLTDVQARDRLGEGGAGLAEG